MSFDLTIIRHAPTAYNKSNTFMGSLDISPDNISESDIEVVRRLLSQKKFVRVFSSPLRRASITANYLFGNKYNIIFDDRLSERCLGDWQGLKKDEIKTKFPDAFKNDIMDFYYTPQNGEPFEKMIKRISSFILELSKLNENVVVVTHNGVFRVMKSLLTGESLSKVFFEFEPFLRPQSFYVDKKLIEIIKDNPFYTVDKNIVINQ